MNILEQLSLICIIIYANLMFSAFDKCAVSFQFKIPFNLVCIMLVWILFYNTMFYICLYVQEYMITAHGVFAHKLFVNLRHMFTF